MLLARIRQSVLLTPVCTAVWFLFIGVSSCLTVLLNLSWGMVPVLAFGFLAIHEIVAFILGRGLFPSAERVARIYQWGRIFMDGYATADFKQIGDLTEGYFNGDYTKTLEQATTDKFDKIIALLGLKKGDQVLDVGCGLGDFLFHLKQKGIHGTGVTVSPDQVRIASGRGLDVRYFDFRQELPQEFVGRFDAVIFMGSLEHFCQVYTLLYPGQESETFQKVFVSARKALNPNSRVGKVYSTTLHMNSNYRTRLKDRLFLFLLHGHYSGNYPKEGVLVKASEPYFRVVHSYDASEDYQYSSIASNKHFGHFSVNWSLKKICWCVALFILNPFAWSTWLYHVLDVWMWQFGGLQIVPETQRPTKTIWYVYERVG